ncbi:MAG: SLC13 family permease, partial [Desulfobacterales bacterium]|jgi:di/tricarboxylate transporter
VATLILLVTEKISVDLTAIGVMVVLMVSGILTPTETVAGFSSPAVVTVGAMFLISKGMIRTGAVGYVSRTLMRLAGDRPGLAMSLILGVVALASAFINNTAVVVLFIPIVMSISCQLGMSPSKLLIPVSYASILAGTCTLIGTSTNIIISDLSAAHGYGALGMFELAPLGVPIALVGLLFLLGAGPRLMPSVQNPVCELENKQHQRYLAEISIPRGSPYAGREALDVFKKHHPDIEVIELIRYSHVYYPERDATTLAPDDLLLVKGSASGLVELLASGKVELPLSEAGMKFNGAQNESLIVELIILPQSSLLGTRLLESRLRRDPDIHIIAIQRRKLHFTETKIHDIRLKTGDILLVRLPEASLVRLRGQSDFIILEDVHHEIVHKHMAGRAFGIFAAMVATATSGILNIMTAALAAAFLMILTGCLPLRDAYRALEPRVLLIIIGTFALSAALEKTGASNLYAEYFLGLFAPAGPPFVLGAVILLTSISTQILSNNATAILILPMAVATAAGLGVDPKPFIVAVCFGASACFATPIGYQTNLLVYGPGGYRFSDFLKLGVIFIPMIWPF